MDDALELSAFRAIAKDDAPKGLSVERAVWIEDCLTKRLYDFFPGRFTWFDDVSRKFIGIDNDGAALLEHLGDGAFAGGDAACKADHNHGCGA